MDLSIIIPVYNTNIDIFNRCIKSIENIDNLNYEILVVNDGSERSYSEEYRKVVKSNSVIKYYEKENAGVSSARNYGIEMATGKYIMFVDADDICISTEILKKYISYKMDVVIFNKVYINEKNRVTANVKELECEEGKVEASDIFKDYILRGRFRTVWANLICRSFLEKNNIKFDTNLIQGEDANFNLEILLHNPEILYVNSYIYKYFYDFCTLQSRLKRESERVFDNFYYNYVRKREQIEKFIDKDKIEMVYCNLENDAINYIFQLCLIGPKKQHLESAIIYLDKLNTNSSLKPKVQYWIVKKKILVLVYILSIIRKIYLKFFKKVF